MKMPKFPKDLSLDEKAIIIDRNVIDRINIDSILNDETFYSTKKFLHQIDKNIARVLHGSKRFNKLRRNRIKDRPGNDRIDTFLKLLSKNSTLDNGLKQRLKNDVIFCTYFMHGCGYLVDERSKDDLIAQRMRVYKKEIKSIILPLVPKVFIKRNYGELNQNSLSERLVHEAVSSYNVLLSEFDPHGFLSRKVKSDFSSSVYYFCTDGASRVKTSNINEDISLVALACAVPAKTVKVYSNDTDVMVMTIISNLFLDLENIILSKKLSFSGSDNDLKRRNRGLKNYYG